MTFKRGLLSLALAIILSLLPTALAVTPEDYDPEQPSVLENDHLYAESAFLFDMDTMEVLLSKNSRVRRYPASTTKIMTAILALESNIGLDETVTIPKEAGNVPEGSSVIGIKPGDTMTWRDLIYGLMLRSGNDGSNAIAVLAAGSIDGFVERMNAKAAELNCEGTHFVNAHGYHDNNHYTTAQDLARMALYAMQNADFREIAATAHYDISVTRNGTTATSNAENRNSLVVPESDYYYPDATGIKTGHHNKSGRCVVASAERDGVRLIAVVLDCSNEEKQFTDAKKLFEYGFSQYSPCTMAELLNRMAVEMKPVTVPNASEDDPGGGQLQLRLGTIAGGDATRMLQRSSERAVSLAMDDIRNNMEVSWGDGIAAPIQAGDQVGTLRFEAPDGTPVTAQLLATRDVEAKAEPTAAPTKAPQKTASPPRHADDERRSGGPVAMLLIAVTLLALAAVLVAAFMAGKDRRRRAKQRRRAAARRGHTASPNAAKRAQPPTKATVRRPKKRRAP